jgi:tRNA A37 threonylcarbamoyladenosine dehydratase
MDHTRHIGIFYAKNYTVTLIGAGGIGAITAITLAKMGVGQLHIFDSDDVEEINIATQFHQVSDVGKSKVSALAQTVEAFSGLTPMTTRHELAMIAVSCRDQIFISQQWTPSLPEKRSGNRLP